MMKCITCQSTLEGFIIVSHFLQYELIPLTKAVGLPVDVTISIRNTLDSMQNKQKKMTFYFDN